MGSRDYQREEVSTGSDGDSDIGVGSQHFLRQVARQIGILIASLLAGLAVGVAYRFYLTRRPSGDSSQLFRSGLQGAGGRLGRPRRPDGLRRARDPAGLGAARTTAARGRTRRPSGRNGRRGDRG